MPDIMAAIVLAPASPRGRGGVIMLSLKGIMTGGVSVAPAVESAYVYQ